MTDATSAAMTAIELALTVADANSDHVATAAEIALDNALTTVIERFRQNVGENTAVVDALDTLAGEVSHALVPAAQFLLWSEDGPLALDENEIEEARARAAIGQIQDCLHHLERALPQGYGIIAERLADHFRSRP